MLAALLVNIVPAARGGARGGGGNPLASSTGTNKRFKHLSRDVTHPDDIPEPRKLRRGDEGKQEIRQALRQQPEKLMAEARAAGFEDEMGRAILDDDAEAMIMIIMAMEK